MTDRNRNQDQPTRGQQGLQDRAGRDENLNEINGGRSSERPHRDRPAIADDRGLDRDRRSFGGDREHDELGSEMEDGLGYEDRDDELDDPGQSER